MAPRREIGSVEIITRYLDTDDFALVLEIREARRAV